MAYQKKTPEERRAEVNQAFDDIAAQVPRVFESENFKNYLDMNSRLHSYSINNLIMIGIQKPDAKMVAGYQAWQKNFNRTVNKGEKGIAILAPSPYKYTREVDRVDADGRTVVGADGQPEKETKEYQGMGFRRVYVFDVSQTSGELFPEIAHELTGSSKEAYDLLESVTAVCDVPINFMTPEEDEKLRNAHGYFSPATGEITVDDSAAYDQKAKTLVHEWAHARLHNEDNGKSPARKEIEAEATAYVVSRYFGMDTGDYSFEYVAAFADGKDSKELKGILDGIQKNADEMICLIDEMYKKVKEKNKDLEIPEADKEEPVDADEKALLISAMQAAGYEYDDINSSDNNLRFASALTGDSMFMGGWKEVREWLEGVVLDDPEASDAVEKIMHPERFEEKEELPEKSEEEKKLEHIDDLFKMGLVTFDEAEQMRSEALGIKRAEPEKDESEKEKREKKPASEKRSSPARSDEKIEDFGEKIGGARKDMWAGRGLSTKDLEFMNEAERASFVKKDSIWPKPDYQAMHDEGVPREVCWYIKTVRDKVSAKPVPGHADIDSEQRRYFGFVSELRDAVMACRTTQDIQKAATFFQDNGFCQKRGGLYAPYEPTEKAGRYLDNKLFKAVQGGRDIRGLIREANKKDFLLTKEEKILKPYRFESYSRDMVPLATRDKGRFLCLREGTSTSFVYPDKGIDLNSLKEDEWFVIRGSRVIATGLPHEDACRQFVFGLEKKLEEMNKEQDKPDTGRKTALKPPQLAHVERVGGEDYRQGKDITGQAYLDDFGFRGGEFGNWTNQKDRQVSLNMGYDAFKDLAKALNISDRDVALDGGLAIAFGARGKGSALAHYEPMREVINLTKMRGAGSLGHEWIHAVDDYVGKKLGVQSAEHGHMLSECNAYQYKNVIPESFTKLMDTIKYRIVSGDELIQRRQQELDKNAASFRSSLESISKKGATPELEAKRQELIDAVVAEAKASYNYEFVSMKESWRSVKAVQDKAPSPAYKAFVDFQKEHGDYNPDTNQNRLFVNSQRHLIGSLADRIVNHPSEMKPARTDSRFYADAKAIDSSYSKSGHGYWSSDCELLARAGAAYIKDKCSELGVRNDYLSGHADTFPVGKGSDDLHYTSPQGEERKTINKAFDAFFGELRDLGLFHENSITITRSLDDAIEYADTVAQQRIADAAKNKGKEPERA